MITKNCCVKQLSFGIERILSKDISSENNGISTIAKNSNFSVTQPVYGNYKVSKLYQNCKDCLYYEDPDSWLLTLIKNSCKSILGDRNIIRPVPVRPFPKDTTVFNTTDTAKKSNCRRRSWSRAVFSSLQRKGLERRFALEKYITKPDRRQLAATLGLTDAQVKVWFQNRRMKWRHTKEGCKIIDTSVNLNYKNGVQNMLNDVFYKNTDLKNSDGADIRLE